MLPVRMPSKNSVKSERSSTSSKQISAKRTTFKTKTLLRKRNDLSVIYNEDDVTPKLLAAIESGMRHEILSLSQLEIRSNYQLSIFGNLSASVLHSNIHTQSIAAVSQQSYISILNKDDFLDEDYSHISSTSEISIESGSGVIKKQQIMPTRINIVLTETPVIYIFDIPSITEVKGTEEGNKVEKDNEVYEFLTHGKGKNRKTTNAEIQTGINLQKTRSTYAKRERHSHDYAFASTWDMHDTYGIIGESQLRIINITPSKSKKLLVVTDTVDIDKQMETLINNPRFQRSVLIMERVLANNIFNEQQKRFRGLVHQDPFRADIEFKYKLDKLWTFKNSSVEGHPVTAMEWHPFNPDILAVGYGKFNYNDKKTGIMYCWNVKNPSLPEREYKFKEPITSLCFSKYETNLMAVGLFNGAIAVLDICSKNVQLVMMSNRHEFSSYEPIWQVAWFAPDSYNINENHVIGVTQDGRVCSFVATKTNDIFQHDNMRVFRTETKLKGVYHPKMCAANEIPISKTAAGLTLTKHSIEEGLYYVGTSEGSIQKCSENYQNQHIDVFMAHAGPVYGLQFSHFCSKLFLSCGADSCINIWVEDIKEPVAVLTKSLDPIEGAEWCPANSTIIANISGNRIYLWDLQRKTYLPASEHLNPSNCRNTVIKFTPSGRNLVVGDIEGNIHVYALEDIPFPPFYQAQMLEQVLYKNLITRPELVKTIRQVGMCYKEGEMKIF